MPGTLADSPAAILAQLLVDEGLANDYTSTTWPVFVGAEPSEPDACITVRDYGAQLGSWSQTTGEPHERHLVQVRVRATTHPLGWGKIRDITESLGVIYHATVTVGANDYCVETINRPGGITPLGFESGTKRQLFTLNVLVLIRPL